VKKRKKSRSGLRKKAKKKEGEGKSLTQEEKRTYSREAHFPHFDSCSNYERKTIDRDDGARGLSPSASTKERKEIRTLERSQGEN